MRTAELCATRVNRVAEIMVINAYISIMVLIPLAVFFRYVLNDSLVWAEELSRYLFIWITFLGAGIGVGKNIHVGVDAVAIRLSTDLQQRLRLLVNFGVLLFLSILIVYGLRFTMFGMETNSMVIGIPMGYVYLAAPVGGIVMLANVMLDIMHILGGKS